MQKSKQQLNQLVAVLLFWETLSLPDHFWSWRPKNMAISSAHANLITHAHTHTHTDTHTHTHTHTHKIKAIAQPIAEISIILISAHFPRSPKCDNLQSRWQSHLRQHSKNTCAKLHTQYSLDWKEGSYIIFSFATRLLAHQNTFQISKFS